MVKRREDMDHYLNAQLEKLQCEQIDYYLLHSLNGGAWDELLSLGVLEFLDRAKADGRIANAGFSFHGLLSDFKRIVDGYPWEICQIQYNYLDLEHQAGTEGLAYAAARNLGVIIMEPLRGGNLGLAPAPAEIDSLWQGAAHPRPPVEWALRWIWNHPEVTVVLSGMNEEAHIEQNLGIAAEARPHSLNAAEMELVAQVGRKYREIMAVDCTGCGYCQPCPSGVNIPSCFDVYNSLKMFGNADKAKLSYVIRLFDLDGTDHGYASGCTQCGECLPKCPQELIIPDLLESVAAAFETDDLAQREAIVRQFLQIK